MIGLGYIGAELFRMIAEELEKVPERIAIRTQIGMEAPEDYFTPGRVLPFNVQGGKFVPSIPVQTGLEIQGDRLTLTPDEAKLEEITNEELERIF
jgi:hypothetical protein